MMKKIFSLFVLALILLSCTNEEPTNKFVTVKDGQFLIDNEPYYFIGTNYWYGSILGSEGEGGNRQRLIDELDLMQDIGITNLRVLVGAEGGDDFPWRVYPPLILEPGVYNDTILDGLDFFMAELAKRDMYAVLFLNNSWEWSGGYGQYLKWNDYGDVPYAQLDTTEWVDFMNYVAQFHSCEPCIQDNYDFIKFVIERTNRYTGVKYTEDPHIMTWEIANEPRAFRDDNKEAFAEWIGRTAAFIKSLAPNQLVATGTEGEWGCENDMDLFIETHSFPEIDYLTFHIWPNNWSWIDKEDIPGTLDVAIEKTSKYFDDHIKVAINLNKPVVFEEFGLPRDGFSYSPESTTESRDKYYQFAFEKVLEHSKNGGVLAGTNFWAFGGYGKASEDDIFWSKGDDLMGDPPQEEQGLNAVFATDTTIDLIRSYSKKMGIIK